MTFSLQIPVCVSGSQLVRSVTHSQVVCVTGESQVQSGFVVWPTQAWLDRQSNLAWHQTTCFCFCCLKKRKGKKRRQASQSLLISQSKKNSTHRRPSGADSGTHPGFRTKQSRPPHLSRGNQSDQSGAAPWAWGARLSPGLLTSASTIGF